MAKLNPGKVFENAFKSSIPSYCFVHRLKDSAQAYNKSEVTSFSWDNPCDFFIFNPIDRTFFAIECKSTKSTSMSVEFEGENKNNKKMIKRHQVKELSKMSKYDHVVAGLLLNFRDEFKSEERTYFMFISDFNKMMSETNKKSCNEKDILQYGGIVIHGVKKRVNYRWDIDGFFKSINK